MSARAAALALLILGCHKEVPDAGPGDDTEDPGLPSRCNAGVAYESGAAFEDRTDAWGLSGVNGGRLSAADLDGDGYPDLVVSETTAHARDDFAGGVRYHYVLMNRAGADGGRAFVDETEASGLFTPREGEGGASAQIHIFGDVDNDGDLDAFSGSFYDANSPDTDPGDRSEVYLNQGDGTFVLAAESDVHIAGGYATAGASFTDVDADGLLDLWVVGWYEQYGYVYGEQDHLYRGHGDGTFTDVTGDAGLEMVRGRTADQFIDGLARRSGFGATSCDLNGDAMPDLLATNYGRAWNQQWMNDGAAVFTDVAMESGFAGDDDLDYSDNQFYRCYCEVYGCDPDPGPASLSPCSTYADYWAPDWDDQPFRLNGNSFATTCSDVDNDGDMDLLTAEIVHWHIGGSSDPTELLLNDGQGAFSRPGVAETGLEREWPSSSWNAGDLYSATLDFDLDGWRDLLVASSDYPDTRLFLWRQTSPLLFREVATEAGIDHPWPAGLAVADFDRDGDLDVVTGSSTARSGTPWTTHEVHLYENQLAPGNSLRVTLQGQEANRAGIGASVSLTAGGITQTQEVSGGYGHFGMQQDVALTFGLGEGCAVDEVVVTWPGGAVDHYEDLPANYAVELAQGGAVTVLDAP